jgi:SAM-dependent methyltransferase
MLVTYFLGMSSHAYRPQTTPTLSPALLTNHCCSWDQTYERELKNNEEDGDVGQVWFGGDTQRRMLQWVVRKVLKVDEDETPDESLRVVDIGCGNGMALVKLAKTYGFKPSQLFGLDYSPLAIELAKQVAHQKLNKKKKTDEDDDNEEEDEKEQGHNDNSNEPPKQPSIGYYVCDLLIEDVSQMLAEELRPKAPFDLVLDKGTFDAMSLQGRDVSAAYLRAVKYLVRPETGWFVITSCNYTREEIIFLFATQGGLRLHGHLPYPEIQFGGQKGSTVCTVAFQVPAATAN